MDNSVPSNLSAFCVDTQYIDAHTYAFNQYFIYISANFVYFFSYMVKVAMIQIKRPSQDEIKFVRCKLPQND